MSNRNATATWSGFSHQGQIGLLVALREIRRLIEDNQESGLTNYFLEYENKEDVAVYNVDEYSNKSYLSIHQVKAYYSDGHLLNTYKPVFQGAIIYQTDSDGKLVKENGKKIATGNYEPGQWSFPPGKNFLHTVKNISNWDENTVSEWSPRFSIERYEYSTSEYHCDTTNIEDYVKREILQIVNDDSGRADSAYHRITFALDEKIRTEHKKGKKTLYDIKFSLKEIYDCIISTLEFDKQNIFNSRKGFYKLYAEYIKIHEISEDKIRCITNTILDPIYRMNDEDFQTFLIQLNLHEDPKEVKLPHYSFKPQGFKQVFFKVLFEVYISPELKEQAVKYHKAGSSEDFVLTTITDEEDYKEVVVVNILKNLDSLDILWDNHALINKEIDGKLCDLNPNINNIPTRDIRDKKKFMSYSEKTRLIPRNDATKKLNDE